jgi:hypothetical protein
MKSQISRTQLTLGLIRGSFVHVTLQNVGETKRSKPTEWFMELRVKTRASHSILENEAKVLDFSICIRHAVDPLVYWGVVTKRMKEGGHVGLV